MQRINLSNVSSGVVNQWKVINTKLTKKTKGTVFEKWMKYWQQLAKDYKDVAINLKQEMRQKPLKSAAYISGLGFLSFCMTHNPNLQSFRAKYVQCANDLCVISPSIVNPQAAEHLKYIEQCFNANLIRYTNLGILSIVWVDNYSKECNIYENNCSYLKIPYRKFSEHILDIGFLNVWWVTSKKMLDYDVNF